MPFSGYSALHGVNPNFKKMMFESNFQMDITVELDFKMSVMNVMALVLYYGCFLDHQTILSQHHITVVFGRYSLVVEWVSVVMFV